jgi:hypothetical protein
MIESPLSPLDNIEKEKKLITIVICKVRRLGGENGQFWHNRPSNE